MLPQENLRIISGRTMLEKEISEKRDKLGRNGKEEKTFTKSRGTT
jgi:hypothetical protein